MQKNISTPDIFQYVEKLKSSKRQQKNNQQKFNDVEKNNSIEQINQIDIQKYNNQHNIKKQTNQSQLLNSYMKKATQSERQINKNYNLLNYHQIPFVQKKQEQKEQFFQTNQKKLNYQNIFNEQHTDSNKKQHYQNPYFNYTLGNILQRGNSSAIQAKFGTKSIYFQNKKKQQEKQQHNTFNSQTKGNKRIFIQAQHILTNKTEQNDQKVAQNLEDYLQSQKQQYNVSLDASKQQEDVKINKILTFDSKNEQKIQENQLLDKFSVKQQYYNFADKKQQIPKTSSHLITNSSNFNQSKETDKFTSSSQANLQNSEFWISKQFGKQNNFQKKIQEQIIQNKILKKQIQQANKKIHTIQQKLRPKNYEISYNSEEVNENKPTNNTKINSTTTNIQRQQTVISFSNNSYVNNQQIQQQQIMNNNNDKISEQNQKQENLKINTQIQTHDKDLQYIQRQYQKQLYSDDIMQDIQSIQSQPSRAQTSNHSKESNKRQNKYGNKNRVQNIPQVNSQKEINLENQQNEIFNQKFENCENQNQNQNNIYNKKKLNIVLPFEKKNAVQDENLIQEQNKQMRNSSRPFLSVRQINNQVIQSSKSSPYFTQTQDIFFGKNHSNKNFEKSQTYKSYLFNGGTKRKNSLNSLISNQTKKNQSLLNISKNQSLEKTSKQAALLQYQKQKEKNEKVVNFKLNKVQHLIPYNEEKKRIYAQDKIALDYKMRDFRHQIEQNFQIVKQKITDYVDPLSLLSEEDKQELELKKKLEQELSQRKKNKQNRYQKKHNLHQHNNNIQNDFQIYNFNVNSSQDSDNQEQQAQNLSGEKLYHKYENFNNYNDNQFPSDSDTTFDDSFNIEDDVHKKAKKNDINWQLYHIKMGKKGVAESGQQANKSYQENDPLYFINNDEFQDSGDNFISSEKTYEIEILMNIFRPKILRDKQLELKLKNLFYTKNYFMKIFEKYLVFVLARQNEKEKEKIQKEKEAIPHFRSCKITNEIFQELINYFDYAIKAKYNYSQFVINDYLASFQRFSKSLLLYDTILVELGGFKLTNQLLEEILDYFYTQDPKPQILQNSQLTFEQYKKQFIELLISVFQNKEASMHTIRVKLKNLHDQTNYTYKEFYHLKFIFWQIMTTKGDNLLGYKKKNNFNRLTILKVIQILEEGREYIIKGYKRPEQIENLDKMNQIYEDFEWRVSIDMKCIQPFAHFENNSIFNFFVKGIFNWTVLNYKTHEWIVYITYDVVKISESIFDKIVNYIIQGLIKVSVDVYFIREVQIRSDHLGEILKIKQPQLIKAGGPKKIDYFFKRLPKMLIQANKDHFIQSFIEKNKNQVKQQDLELFLKKVKNIKSQTDYSWLVFVLTILISDLDCYHPLDFKAALEKHRLDKNHILVQNIMQNYKLSLQQEVRSPQQSIYQKQSSFSNTISRYQDSQDQIQENYEKNFKSIKNSSFNPNSKARKQQVSQKQSQLKKSPKYNSQQQSSQQRYTNIDYHNLSNPIVEFLTIVITKLFGSLYNYGQITEYFKIEMECHKYE
ncbi:hypothetical protein PPERSA_09750 [Pseudocohnilembus persalinus]|uniref:Uncharacterized protein n=1 Tax=Pseudocohnilembus persalinus TaxID=266149 RepID=A0A0V0QUB5_PSEPJ|nr:hypothetical protein PPERSA_09750 [Pseudocohnilembus persalinus]|eukprot:KRX05610.1 hypothetical protein PPERSA_09750 [Pseudocohnilembus persalinus]